MKRTCQCKNPKTGRDATFHRDGTVTFWSVNDQVWRRKVPAAVIWRFPYAERDSFSRREWNRVGRLAGAETRSHDARNNPKTRNPLRQVILGHTVTWSPKRGGFVIDAYKIVFPTVKQLRAYLKEHVAKELRHR